MTDPRDPSVVHSGHCARCDRWVRDNEEHLDENNHCDDCSEELDAEEKDEE